MVFIGIQMFQKTMPRTEILYCDQHPHMRIFRKVYNSSRSELKMLIAGIYVVLYRKWSLLFFTHPYDKSLIHNGNNYNKVNACNGYWASCRSKSKINWKKVLKINASIFVKYIQSADIKNRMNNFLWNIPILLDYSETKRTLEFLVFVSVY